MNGNPRAANDLSFSGEQPRERRWDEEAALPSPQAGLGSAHFREPSALKRYRNHQAPAVEFEAIVLEGQFHDSLVDTSTEEGPAALERLDAAEVMSYLVSLAGLNHVEAVPEVMRSCSNILKWNRFTRHVSEGHPAKMELQRRFATIVDPADYVETAEEVAIYGVTDRCVSDVDLLKRFFGRPGKTAIRDSIAPARIAPKKSCKEKE
jgi:hypothetical protein